MPPADYDDAWKDMLDAYFRQFLAFFVPDAEREIDWLTPTQSLEQELRQIAPEAALGGRIVDKLVKVSLLGGKEVWVMVHVEVQGEPRPDFAERMYVYNYRIYDRFHVDVCSVGVLTDDQEGWRPSVFGQGVWGSRGSLQFPVVKLIDYRGSASALAEDQNVFGLVVLSHLAALDTRGSSERRLGEKLSLVRRLYDRGMSGELTHDPGR